MVVLSNADAGVFHAEQNARGHPLQFHQHMPFVGELDGVADQIHQDLHQPVTVGAHPLRHIALNLKAKAQVCALDPGQKEINRVLNRLAQSKGFGPGRQTPCIELRIIQHIVDDGHQMIGRLTRVLQNLPCTGFVGHLIQQERVEAQNGVHGCAQLVADGGNEVLPSLDRVDQFLAFFLQLPLTLFHLSQSLSVLVVVNQRHDDQHTGHQGIGGQ